MAEIKQYRVYITVKTNIERNGTKAPQKTSWLSGKRIIPMDRTLRGPHMVVNRISGDCPLCFQKCLENRGRINMLIESAVMESIFRAELMKVLLCWKA
ncbi:MAG: hypothetical protein ACLFR1_14385 [Spirochaetia bacterium]